MKHEQIQAQDVKRMFLLVTAYSIEEVVNTSYIYLAAWLNDAVAKSDLPLYAYTFKETYTLPKTDREPKIKIDNVSKVFWMEGRDISLENIWLVFYSIT